MLKFGRAPLTSCFAKFGVGLSTVALFCKKQKALLALKELRSLLAFSNRSSTKVSIPHAFCLNQDSQDLQDCQDIFTFHFFISTKGEISTTKRSEFNRSTLVGALFRPRTLAKAFEASRENSRD